ncbi:MAG: acetylornithine/succinylornithine family transaminase [Clostridiales bacterium]|jgi:predicted acetylornithine/succinylornithine family transaminase|nr:acetylornithine/succinylornithine family transaminase [Clostridiales bacterium]
MDKAKILKLHGEYVMQNYGCFPIVFERGEGTLLFDGDGNRYLDFLSGIAVNSLGHNNKGLVRAILRQTKKMLSCSNYFINEPSVMLAKTLLKGTRFKRVFFCNSGTEAAEAAIKIAKKYHNDVGTGAYKFLAFTNSFHGRTIGALAATGQDKYKASFAPLPDWFVFSPFNDVGALKKAMDDDKIAAVIMECIQGEGGVITPSDEFVSSLNFLLKKHKKLLIIDEVQTGVGRTGSFFACSEYGLRPDILFTAKGLAGGVPIGAVLTTEKLSDVLRPGDHGTTFGGNPLAAAAGLAVTKIIKKKSFLDEVVSKGDYLKERLSFLHKKYGFIKEIRGKGLILGMELDPSVNARNLNQKFLDKGLILLAAGNNTLRFLPPLTVKIEEIDGALAIIDEVFGGIAA